MQDQNTTPCNITQLPARKDALTESVIARNPRKRPTVDLTLLAELFKEHYLAGDCNSRKSITEQYWRWLEEYAPGVIDENPPLILIESLAVVGKPLEVKQPTAAMVAIAGIYLDHYADPEYSLERGDPLASGLLEWLRARRPREDIGTTHQRLTALICAEAKRIQKRRG